MVQNRNKLIELFIGNISNSIVHKILEKAIAQEELSKKLSGKYDKELLTSLEIAKKYREKINPVKGPLPNKDIVYIKSKIINKVRAELLIRISRGYKNIELNLVENLVDEFLRKMDVV